MQRQSFRELEPIGIIDDGIRFFVHHFHDRNECIEEIRDNRTGQDRMNGVTMAASASLDSDNFFFAVRKNDGTFIMPIKDQFTVAAARTVRMNDKILVGVNNIFIKLLI